MNTYNRVISRLVIYIFWLSIAALMLMTAPLVSADDAWQLGTHDVHVYGTSDLQSGNMDKAITKLKTRLRLRIHRQRAPVLANLCVAYTMKRDFESAEKYCNESIENGWTLGLAYSNRGVMNIARGDIFAAHADFEAAMKNYGGSSVKRHNLVRCKNRMAVMAADQLNDISKSAQARLVGDLAISNQ